MLIIYLQLSTFLSIDKNKTWVETSKYRDTNKNENLNDNLLNYIKEKKSTQKI